MFYEDTLRMLTERKVRYVVAGGVALVLHGIVRFTADLDIIVEMSEENLKLFVQCMNDLGFKPRVPVRPEEIISAKNRERWRDEKGMKVFTFVHSQRQMQQVDVFVEEYIPYPEIERECIRVQARDIAIPIVSINHLKALKKISGRPQDMADIEMLEEMERDGGTA